MTTIEVTQSAEVGDRVSWRLLTLPRRYGRVTAIKPRPQAVWDHQPPVIEYHILGDDGVAYAVAAKYVRKDEPEPVVTFVFNELDVKPCRRCGAYLQSGLQTTVHPHHSPSCELYPDNAWHGYKLTKIGDPK